MSRRVVAGNWKLNPASRPEAQELLNAIVGSLAEVPSGVELIVCPPFPYLVDAPKGTTLAYGAQDCSRFGKGAYTGDVSAEIVRDLGATYVIIGHSERRQYMAEGNEILRAKLDRALEAGLKPIFCCGEPLEIREKGDKEATDYVLRQLDVLTPLAETFAANGMLAYEPIWAIGTGRTATPAQAGDMCQAIHGKLATDLPKGNDIPVLYGGSCNASNAKELFAQAGINGGLIGGASLKPADFIRIAQSF